MSPWEVLGIGPTTDRRKIKKAYASKLKLFHPEDDPEGFQSLRAAYELALFWLEGGDSGETATKPVRLAATADRKRDEQRRVEEAVEALLSEVKALERRANAWRSETAWKALLLHPLLAHLETRVAFDRRLFEFLGGSKRELKDPVWLLLDQAFQWTACYPELYRTIEPGLVDWVLARIQRARRERFVPVAPPRSSRFRQALWTAAVIAGWIAGMLTWALMGSPSRSHRNDRKESKSSSCSSVDLPWLRPAMKIKPVKWHIEAADHGDIASQWELGFLVFLRNDPDARKWVEEAARKDNAVAQYWLGYFVDSGHRMPRDPAAAAAWYRKAASSVPHAAVGLGNLYENGQGVPRDLAEAFRWYRRAAEAGLLAGQVRMEEMCASLGRAEPSWAEGLCTRE